MEMIESGFVELTEKCVRKDGSALIKIIQPGWGSSGFYPAEVLERDGPKVFTAGTQMFWNHQTAEEESARPEGDLNNLAAKLVSDARWMPDHPQGAGLYAEAQVYGGYQQAVNEMGPDIGVSIRAMGKARTGEADGQRGPIIQEIAAAKSVDFVTKPGAGGAVLELFESARRGAAHTQEGDKTMGELEALKESNAQLQARLDRLSEALLLREAGDYVAGKLAKTNLPLITRERLQKLLAANPPIKEGKIDGAAYDSQIAEAVKAEAEYLVAVGGGGKVTGMGMAESAEPKPEELSAAMAEAWKQMGYDEKMAVKLAEGR